LGRWILTAQTFGQFNGLPLGLRSTKQRLPVEGLQGKLASGEPTCRMSPPRLGRCEHQPPTRRFAIRQHPTRRRNVLLGRMDEHERIVPHLKGREQSLCCAITHACIGRRRRIIGGGNKHVCGLDHQTVLTHLRQHAHHHGTNAQRRRHDPAKHRQTAATDATSRRHCAEQDKNPHTARRLVQTHFDLRVHHQHHHRRHHDPARNQSNEASPSHPREHGH